MTTTQELVDQLVERDIEHLWVAYTDYHGRMAGRDVPRQRFAAVAERGTNFAKANFNFTIRDLQAPDPYFGADTGDVLAVPEPESVVEIPYRPRTALAFATLREEDGQVWSGCPRGALNQAVAALVEVGLKATVAFEPEFYLFTEDGRTPASRAGMYTIAGLDDAMAFVDRLNTVLPAMGVELEQIGKEYGQGQFEANIAPADPAGAADDLLLLRLAIRAVAREFGLRATFMPKLDAAVAGCGLHVHLSLQDVNTGEDRTASAEHASGLSETALRFMAGWLAHAEALSGLGSPTSNSYKRLQPASWAPAHVCWGVGNRAALVRVPGKGRARLEFRSGDNTSNPYLLLTALIRAGLDGLARNLEPGEPVAADVGHLGPAELVERGIRFLPRDAQTALEALDHDEVLAAGLGPLIHREFLRVKRAELLDYNQQVSAWERDAYLEAP